jgi:hypothetical protein
MIFLYLLIGVLFSQPWMDNLTPEQQNNFYEIQKNFNEWVKDKDLNEKGTGIKQYKRWEDFWRHRVYEDGSFPTGLELTEAFQSVNKSKNPTLQSSLEWKFQSRTSSPGGYNGLGRVNVVKEDPTNSNIWWAGSASGGLWKTTNRGQSWTTNTDKIANFLTLGVSDILIDPNNTNIMYLATGDKNQGGYFGVGVLKSTNGGNTWNTTGLSFQVSSRVFIGRMAMNPNNTNNIIATSNDGIYVTTNGGTNWTKTFNSHCKDVVMKPNNPNIVYATTYQNPARFIKSTDGGVNWNVITNGLPASDVRRMELAVTSNANDNVYLLASANNHGLKGVYLSTNSGDDFTLLADSPNMLGHNQTGASSGGQGWYDLTIAVPNDDKNTILIGGVVTWKSTNLGSTWSLNNFWYNIGTVPTVHADQHYFRFANDGTLLVGNDGGVYASTNKGETWLWRSEDLAITQIYKISSSQHTLDHFIFGSQDNGTMLKRKNGSWTDSYGGDGMKCLFDPTTDDVIFASIQYGNPIVKSTNNGGSWRRINDNNNDNEYDDIDETGAWVTPYALDPSNTDIMYVGMDNIWKSTNGGRDFTKINTTNTSKFEEIYVSEKNPNFVYAATSNQFFKSTNKGSSWTAVTRPGNQNTTDFCINPNDENILWATNSGWNASNKVFYSTNGGDSWTNISSGLPNIPIYCVKYQKNKDNRIYIGTEIGAYYRDDNSGGWVYFSDGLPNVIVRDISINEKDSRMYAGTYGRGSWYIDLIMDIPTPTLASPTTNTKNRDINGLQLSWNNVNVATSYHVQVSKNSNFSTVAFENQNVSGTSVTIDQNLDYFSDYFWRVRAKAGGNQSQWSNTWIFKTKIGLATLVAPINDKVNEPIQTEFTWSQVTGAIKYYIQVSTTQNFANIEKSDSTESNKITLSQLTHNTKYYWRVRVLGPDGLGDWSAPFSFTTNLAAPELSLPLNSSNNISIEPKLEWSSVNGGQTYDIQISDSPNFTEITKNITNHGMIDVDVSDLQNATTYYWRVKAHNANSNSDWSEVWSFNTKLASAALIFPPNDSTYLDKSVTLQWNNVIKSQNYTLQVSDNSNFQNNSVNQQLPTTNFKLDDLDYNKKMFWRVKASSTFGESDWSSVYNFRVKLQKPNLISPENEKENVELNTNLNWDAVTGSNRYLLQISESEEFTSNLVDEIVSTNSFNYFFSNNRVYFWRVRCLSDDNQSDWSETFTFSTPIEVPVLLSPADNSILNDLNVILTWRRINTASDYYLDLATDPAFNNILVNNFTTTEINFSANNLEFDTKYFWRVRAKVNNNLTDNSDVWSFEIKNNVSLPSSVILTSPENGATNIDTNSIKLTWNASENADSYAVEVSYNEDFTPALFNEISILETEFTLNELESNKKHYWRVKALNNDGESEFSPIWAFTTIQADPGSGVNYTIFNGKEYKLFPNPAEDYIFLEVNQGTIEFDIISVYDLNANLLSNFDLTNQKLSSFKINISNLSTGAYIVKLNKNNETIMLRFIKD